MSSCKPARRAACPQCGDPVDMSSANAWRPFCSERCKLLDLGAWTSGRYAIGSDDEVQVGGAQDAESDSQ